jgi:hypothetical protein
MFKLHCSVVFMQFILLDILDFATKITFLSTLLVISSLFHRVKLTQTCYATSCLTCFSIRLVQTTLTLIALLRQQTILLTGFEDHRQIFHGRKLAWTLPP